MEDYSKACRLCLKNGEHNIFDTPHLTVLLNEITKLKIHEDDKLPNTICHTCFTTLQNIQQFIHMSKASYSTLIAHMIQRKDQHQNTAIKDSTLLQDEIEGLAESQSCRLDSLSTYSEVDLNNKLHEASKHDNFEQEVKQRSVKCEYFNRNFSRLAHSNLKPFKCVICSSQYSRKSSLTSHLLVHSSIKPLKCTLCAWIGKTDNDLNQHMTDQHADKKSSIQTVQILHRRWCCAYCGKIFSKKDDLQRHLRIHTGYRPFKCTYCDKNFTQKSTMIRHIQSIHIQKQSDQSYFQCFICEKKFLRKDHLEQHIANLHIKKQGFVDKQFVDDHLCTHCNKNFSLEAYLNQHLEKVHNSNKRAINCTFKKILDKTSRLSSLPKLCSICGKLFQKGKTYRAHMSRCHSLREVKLPDRPNDTKKPKEKFQCWHCGKIVNTRCNLAVHLRVHTGEKPYQCKFCPRRFSVWTSRQEHENIHTGVKPFQCEPCNKGFKQRSALLKHLRSAIHQIQAKICT